MTRWDCDVKLWRGVPCSFPAFHGWPPCPLLPSDIIQSSTASVRYICCDSCYEWVPEFTRDHSCLLSKPGHIDLIRANDNKTVTDTTNATDNDTATDDDNNSLDEKPVYVISTDENWQTGFCGLCHDRMRQEFLHDLEEWVFMDCVEHDGVPIHKFCHDAVYG